MLKSIKGFKFFVYVDILMVFLIFSFNKYMLGIFIRGMLLEIGGSFLVIIIRKIVMERSVVIFIESFLLELLGI